MFITFDLTYRACRRAGNKDCPARNKCRIELFEVEGTEQKPIRFSSAGTKADYRTKSTRLLTSARLAAN